MSTPSRVTRSSSRQPERVTRARSSSRRRSSTAASPAAAPASAKKKSSSTKKTPSRATSDSSATPKKPSSSRKKRVSRADADPEYVDGEEEAQAALSRASRAAQTLQRKARSAIEEARAELEAGKEKVAKGARRMSGQMEQALNGEEQSSSSSSATQTKQPLVALLPWSLAYAALASLAHLLVLFSFAKQSLQENLILSLHRFSFGLMPLGEIQAKLQWTESNHIGFWTVVPMYLTAGMLLKYGVREVVGAGKRAARLSFNLSRLISGLLLILTVVGYTAWDRPNSYEGVQALFVLQFAFMLQELVINFRVFQGPRVIFSLFYLAVVGVFSALAYDFVPSWRTPTQAPPLMLAINYALLIVNTSANLGALAEFASLVCRGSVVSVAATALQSVVNFGALPVVAVSLFHKHNALFQSHVPSKQPTFIEASAGSMVMVGLTFLLIVDSYLAVQKKKDKQQ